jgi:Icc protein
MRLRSTVPTAVTELVYRQARRGGGTETARLPVQRLAVDAVPAGCDGVLVTGDLQGTAPSPWGGPPVLLGVALADHLRVWADAGLLPPPERLGVVLAGDLYCAPAADVRGASGPVDEVWLAFATAGCPVVLGVAGNHDEYPPDGRGDLGPGTVLLDGTHTDAGGIRLAGVGGVIGDPQRPGRRAERPHLDSIAALLADAPDVLVLHEGPPGRPGATRQPANRCADSDPSPAADGLRPRALGESGHAERAQRGRPRRPAHPGLIGPAGTTSPWMPAEAVRRRGRGG